VTGGEPVVDVRRQRGPDPVARRGDLDRVPVDEGRVLGHDLERIGRATDVRGPVLA
jgi:hypothetical protein